MISVDPRRARARRSGEGHEGGQCDDVDPVLHAELSLGSGPVCRSIDLEAAEVEPDFSIPNEQGAYPRMLRLCCRSREVVTNDTGATVTAL